MTAQLPLVVGPGAGRGPTPALALHPPPQLYQLRVLKTVYPSNGDDDTSAHSPLIFRLFQNVEGLRHLGGQLIGLGIREHLSRFPATRFGPTW